MTQPRLAPWLLAFLVGLPGPLAAEQRRTSPRFPKLAPEVTLYRPFLLPVDPAATRLPRPDDGPAGDAISGDRVDEDLEPAQYLGAPPAPSPTLPADPPYAEFEEASPGSGPPDSSIFDPPIRYDGPDPASVEDIEARDGPRIPEPMVFDLVRGLGARKGELEFNVLNIVPFFRHGPHYEWAPEVEYVVSDGFAVEYEVPIFGTEIVAQKFAAQYTFGTAFDDAFIHGVQGIGYFDTKNGDFIPILLYLAGIRLDETWSLFGMMGGSVGPQIFPFSDEPPRNGLDLMLNLSIFANVTERLVLGVETNISSQLRGPTEVLFMPQAHYEITHRIKAQFGFGMREDVEGRHPELGFRIIFER